MTSADIRAAIDECEADLARVRLLLARATDPDTIGALASLATALRKHRRELCHRHEYAVARELAGLTAEWKPAKTNPVFGALMGRNTIPLHTNWRTTR